MKYLNIAILLVLISAVEIKGQDCQQLANEGDCRFYRECVEKENCCGSKWYPLAFGDKYCKQFKKEIECFNNQVLVQVPHSNIHILIVNIYRAKVG